MLDYTQLETLLAVDETGTFEAAARELNISSFAVVQRIKTLEAKLGVKLIERSPTRTTEIGKILCDHAREVRSHEDELTEQHHIDTLQGILGGPSLKIVIIDESLSNWFLTVLDHYKSAEDRLRLDVQLTDAKQAAELMRLGLTVAALTHDEHTVYGYKTHKLGSFNYRAVASPDYIKQYLADGVTPTSLSLAPTMRITSEDSRQQDWLKQVLGNDLDPPLRQHASSRGILNACLRGQVWTMQSDLEVESYLASGELVELVADAPLTRMLYWHVAGTMADAIRPLTRKIKELAADQST